MDGLHQIRNAALFEHISIYIRLNSSLKVARSLEGCDDDDLDVGSIGLDSFENV